MSSLHTAAALEAAIHDLVGQLAQIRRWRRHPSTAPESVSLHLVKMTVLAQVVIALERQANPGRELDWYAVLAACANHDLGEVATGDPDWQLSHDPALRPGLKAEEREAVARLVCHFPVMAQVDLLRHYDLSDDESTAEGRLFRAIHHLGFLLTAIREVLAGHWSYLEVFPRIHPLILESAEEFASIREIYAPLAPQITLLIG